MYSYNPDNDIIYADQRRTFYGKFYGVQSSVLSDRTHIAEQKLKEQKAVLERQELQQLCDKYRDGLEKFTANLDQRLIEVADRCCRSYLVDGNVDYDRDKYEHERTIGFGSSFNFPDLEPEYLKEFSAALFLTLRELGYNIRFDLSRPLKDLIKENDFKIDRTVHIPFSMFIVW